jgi:hypothetical protein
MKKSRIKKIIIKIESFYKKFKNYINDKTTNITKIYKVLCQTDESFIEKFKFILNLLNDKIKIFVLNTRSRILNESTLVKKEYEIFLKYHPCGYTEKELQAICNKLEKDRTFIEQIVVERYLRRLPYRVMMIFYAFPFFWFSLFGTMIVVCTEIRFITDSRHFQIFITILSGFWIVNVMIFPKIQEMIDSSWSRIKRHPINKYIRFAIYFFKKFFKK